MNEYTRGMTKAAQWVWGVAVSMPERWRAGRYGNPNFARPGSVIKSQRPEIREELKTLKSEDLQLNLRPDLLSIFCCSGDDWKRYEFDQENSRLKLEFDKKMRV